MSVLKKRFLLVSDMHYTCEESYSELKKLYPSAKASVAAGSTFGMSQRQKVEKVYEDIISEHNKSPLDAVLVLGDLSIDDYDYRCLPENYCKKFKEDCLDRLPMPCYAIPGNHDSWPNDLWKEVMGRDRQFVLQWDDLVFLMADTFSGTPARKDNPASGSALSYLDDEFLRTNLEKHKGKKIFICAHHIESWLLTEKAKKLIKESGDVVFMFRGHVHVSGVYDMGEECGNVKLFFFFFYGYNCQLVDGKYNCNIFDQSWAWGYQILEIYDDFIKTYQVKTKNKYIADNGVFQTEESVQDEFRFEF